MIASIETDWIVATCSGVAVLISCYALFQACRANGIASDALEHTKQAHKQDELRDHLSDLKALLEEATQLTEKLSSYRAIGKSDNEKNHALSGRDALLGSVEVIKRETNEAITFVLDYKKMHPSFDFAKHRRTLTRYRTEANKYIDA